jgi:hypothetical protein
MFHDCAGDISAVQQSFGDGVSGRQPPVVAGSERIIHLEIALLPRELLERHSGVNTHSQLREGNSNDRD